MGGHPPFVTTLDQPLMLPSESQAVKFELPPGFVNLFAPNEDVIEENQVDTLVINNLNVVGNLPSIGTLATSQFSGMSMGQNLLVLGDGPYNGLEYDEIEIITFNLGDGVNSISVKDTSEAIHILNLGMADDTVDIVDISGPFIVIGNAGSDEVTVSRDGKLDHINALLAFDGGPPTGLDVLHLDNSNDDIIDDVLIVTRRIVQVESMSVPEVSNEQKNPELPRESYLISMNGATDGIFEITLNYQNTVRKLM